LLLVLLIRLVITAAAFAVAEALLSGLEVSGGFWTYLWVALIFGVVNAIIGTILHILALPLTLLTFGLFAILINAVLLEITDALTSKLTIDEFWWTTIWATIIIAVVSMALEWVVASIIDRPRRRTA
jgi:putative membrane protein